MSGSGVLGDDARRSSSISAVVDPTDGEEAGAIVSVRGNLTQSQRITTSTYAIHRPQPYVAYTNPSHRCRLQSLEATTIGPRKKREQSRFVMLKSPALEERLEQIRCAE